MTSQQIENWFSYHAPTGDGSAGYNRLRDAAKEFVLAINEHFPDSATKTAAIKKVLEAVMRTNAAVACEDN